MKKDHRLTRAKLETLTSAELLEIADEYGIDAPDDLNRQFIIGDLLELASELEEGDKVKETIALADWITGDCIANSGVGHHLFVLVRSDGLCQSHT